MIVIPPEQLPVQTLQGLLEEFASRDGTDYGVEEVSLTDKVAELRGQLSRQHILIVYDVGLEQANLITREQYQAQRKLVGQADSD
jgi:uncharacterized protein